MNLIVAIDGPAASGKSTVAALVAARLGAIHADSGSLYRAVTWKCLRAGDMDWTERSVAPVAQNMNLAFRVRSPSVAIEVDGEEPGAELRSDAVTNKVSIVAAMPAVREWVTERLRRMAGLGDLVMEGRDIGSVVFPGAPHKFYLDATPEERARRRQKETGARNDVAAVAESIRRRDSIDSSRRAAPLKKAEGALAIDTTGITAAQVADIIAERVKAGTPRPRGNADAPEKIAWWYWICRAAMRLFMRAMFRYGHSGLERVPRAGGCVLVSNHCSYLDPMAVGCAINFRRIRFVARDTLAESRFMGWWMKSVGVLTIDRNKGDMAALKAIIAALKRGDMVCLFPEGTRSLDGRIHEAKGGIGFLVAKAGVPVVPAYLMGTFAALPKGKILPRPAKVTVAYGPPIGPDEVAAFGSGRDAYRAIGEFIMRRIAELAPPGPGGA